MRNSHPLALVTAFVWPVLAAALSFGQVVATTQPGVAPPSVAGGAAVAPAPAPADGRIAVFPFAATNPQAGNIWIGKSVQQSLSADLLQAAPGRVQTAEAPVSTAADAAAAGRQLGVNYAILGTYSSTGAALRIIGQVVDCSTGNAMSSLKVTGTLGDVFVLEDDLSHQARTSLFGQAAAENTPGYTVHAVPDNSGNVQTYYPPNGQATAPQSSTGYAYPPPTAADQQYQQAYIASPSPSVYYSYPVYSYSYYSSPYYPYYSYPYYGFGYPYVGIGLGFGFGGHYRYGGGYHGGGYGGGFHGGGGGFHGGGGHR